MTDMINQLSNILTEVPERRDTGYYHGELFYSCEPNRESVYIGCLMYDITKEEKSTGYSNGYLYIIEEFKEPVPLSKSTFTKKYNKTQNCIGGDIYTGYIPSIDTAKKYIKKGCSFLSWIKGTRIFTLINLSFAPTSYDHLPGICNEFLNKEIDPKLITLAEYILKSAPSTKQAYLFEGIQLLKKNIGRFSLVTIYNKICETEHENDMYMIIRFEGIYKHLISHRQNKESDKIEVHLIFAPSSPQNTLSILHKKTVSEDIVNNSFKKICASYHNKEPEYIVEIYTDKKTSTDQKKTEIKKILNEIINHANKKWGLNHA